MQPRIVGISTAGVWGANVVRRFIVRNALDNREDRLKAVSENLVARGLIRPALSDRSSVQVTGRLW